MKSQKITPDTLGTVVGGKFETRRMPGRNVTIDRCNRKTILSRGYNITVVVFSTGNFGNQPK